MISFLKYRKIYFVFSGILVLASVICLAVFGLKPSIDFTGGSILELVYKNTRPSTEEIKKELSALGLGEITIQPIEEMGMLLRLRSIDEETHQKIIQKMEESHQLEELRFESIGPVIGRELKQKTKLLIAVSLLAIVFYIAFAFLKIPRPIKSWQYGIASLITLAHDVLIPTGVFSILGKFYGVEISIPVIVALLTILGYSINNTVVVFDRIRENLLKSRGAEFGQVVDASLNQTLTRCLNTSLTTLFVLLAIFFFGSESLKYFSLALIIGITAGTYASIFLVSPILVEWLEQKERG